MNNQKRFFDSFTNLYSLSKTLRFELKPEGRTRESLKKVFEEDRKIEQSYQETKIYLDKLHRQFVQEALAPEKLANLDLKPFANVYATLLKTPKNAQTKEQKTTYEKDKKLLLTNIVKIIDDMGESWKEDYQKKTSIGRTGKDKKIKFTSKGHEILTDEAVLNILIDKYPEKSEIFKKFFGFFTYFGKFNETRHNFYKSDGTSSAIATRIVENFEKFLKNKHIVETKYENIKREIGLTEKEITTLVNIDEYKKYFLQPGIDNYNEILGGNSETDTSVNKKVNEYRQKTKNKIDFLSKLYNQILSEKDRKEIIIVENNTQLQQQIKEFTEKNDQYCHKMLNLFKNILIDNPDQYDWQKVYIHKGAINTISNKYFLNWSVFKGALLEETKKEAHKEKSLPDFVSLKQIKTALESKKNTPYKELFLKEIIENPIFSDKNSHFQNLVNIFIGDLEKLIKESQQALLELKKDNFWTKGTISQKRKEKEDEGTKQIGLITKYLNACRDTHRMIKYFAIEEKKKWKDAENGNDPKFYNKYKEEYDKDIFFPLYNATRNYLTQKPSDENKIKLNFQNGQLLSGWDKNKEKEKLGIILRKNGIFYLAIMRQQFNDIFDENKHPEVYQTQDDIYEKMEYKLFPDPKRMIPKVAFAESNKKAFGWTQEIQTIKDDYAAFQEKKKDDKDLWKDQFDKIKTNKLIEYYQNCLQKGGYQKTFNLSWKKPGEYAGIGDFNNHIAEQNYKLKFVPVDTKYVDERVENGEMYLFQINCKDFSEKSKGTKNIHSLYFFNIFANENLGISPVPLQLAGAAEIFYREASVEEKNAIITKEKKREIKTDSNDIFHYKRFSEPKISFHVSIKINAGQDAIRNQNQFNKFLNTKLLAPHEKDIYLIGVDRGEKHLAYYSLINAKGEIIDGGSFNEIKKIKYHELLNTREKERQENRQSWLPTRQIKDLKKGFVGHAVKKLVDLAIDNNAVIILEDLNMRFKQIRSGIEKSTYQQLEKALIDKLNYLVFKETQNNQTGGILKGYQLAAEAENFKDMTRQTGIVFYTQAAYTSSTDPISGFRKNVYIANEASNEKIIEFIQNCDEIGWEANKKSYFFTYNPINFVEKKDTKNTFSKVWKVYADVPRIKRQRDEHGKWTAKDINPNEIMQNLLITWNFKDIHSKDLKLEILNKLKNGELKGKKEFINEEKEFLNALIYIFNFIMQLRNTDTATNRDFIASPVEPFFTTNDAPKPNSCGLNLDNGDAVGAYNIARKGLIQLKRIKQNPNNPDLFISNKDWDEFVTKDQFIES